MDRLFKFDCPSKACLKSVLLRAFSLLFFFYETFVILDSKLYFKLHCWMMQDLETSKKVHSQNLFTYHKTDEIWLRYPDEKISVQYKTFRVFARNQWRNAFHFGLVKLHMKIGQFFLNAIWRSHSHSHSNANLITSKGIHPVIMPYQSIIHTIELFNEY